MSTAPSRRSTRLRRVAVGLATTGFLLVPSAAHAASVALFDNPDYIDTSDVLDDEEHEGYNVRATYESFGDTVTRFTATDGAGIRAALAGKDVFAMPEQEEDSLNPDLDDDARAAIREYVSGGGRLVVFDDYIDGAPDDGSFLNGVFGWSLDEERDNESWDLVPQAADSPFAGAAPTIEYQDDTQPATTDSLPAGAVPVYRSPDGTSNAVFTVPYGKGTIVFIGYDWYSSAPPVAPEDGGQDGGWIDVLRRASTTPVPAPAPVPVDPAVPAPIAPVVPIAPAAIVPPRPADTTPPIVSTLTATPRQLRWRVSEPAKMQVFISKRTTARRAGRTVVTYRRVRSLQVSKRFAGIASVRLAAGLGHGRFRISVTSHDTARNAGKTVRTYRTW